MNQFFERMMANNPTGLTENGAATHTTSGNACLNYFALAGAKRKDLGGVRKLFTEAYKEDPKTATRLAFYMRDIRGGQGERDVFQESFKVIFNDLAKSQEVDELVRLFGFFPVYGRWKDLIDLTLKVSEIQPTNAPVRYEVGNTARIVGEIFAIQLMNDYRNILEADESNGKVNVSLLAKWLPSINASSKATRAKAQFIAKAMGFDPIQYRRMVRAVREVLETVEEKMSAGGWADIEYSKVPSRANLIYRKAFSKHDSERYKAFIEAAKSGKTKINSSTLYPYEMVKNVLHSPDETVEALWKQLPDYTRGRNGIVVADVSGSMYGDPMNVSVAMALYFAERNKGAFKDCFITFDDEPQLFKTNPNESLFNRIQKAMEAPWGGSTDIDRVFLLILQTAVMERMKQEDMPETIYIVSDMEFNQCARMDKTNYQTAKESFEQAGYKLPNVVFWNVNSRSTNVPVTQNEKGVTLVSGLSPSIFKMVVENKTPIELMLDVVNSPRYNQI